MPYTHTHTHITTYTHTPQNIPPHHTIHMHTTKHPPPHTPQYCHHHQQNHSQPALRPVLLGVLARLEDVQSTLTAAQTLCFIWFCFAFQFLEFFSTGESVRKRLFVWQECGGRREEQARMNLAGRSMRRAVGVLLATLLPRVQRDLLGENWQPRGTHLHTAGSQLGSGGSGKLSFGCQ